MTRPPIPRGAGDVSAQWMQQALTAGGAVGSSSCQRDRA